METTVLKPGWSLDGWTLKPMVPSFDCIIIFQFLRWIGLDFCPSLGLNRRVLEIHWTINSVVNLIMWKSIIHLPPSELWESINWLPFFFSLFLIFLQSLRRSNAILFKVRRCNYVKFTKVLLQAPLSVEKCSKLPTIHEILESLSNRINKIMDKV